MRSITLLGATGSIGASTLDVIARHPDRFSLFAVAAARRVDELVSLCARFSPRQAVIAERERLPALRDALRAAGLPTTARDAASGVDGVTAAAYAEDLQANIQGLAERLKAKRYRQGGTASLHPEGERKGAAPGAPCARRQAGAAGLCQAALRHLRAGLPGL